MVWLLTGTIFVYSIIIAWFKDIPDMEGDRQYAIRTLSLRLGAKKVFLVGNLLISLIYAVLIVLPFLYSLQVHELAFALVHLFLLGMLWLANSRVDLGEKLSIQRYYQFIWVLFFLEYITFAAASFP